MVTGVIACATDQVVLLQITTGEEGFLSSGGSGSGWRNDGTKGVDWRLNLQDPNIAFGTVHVCAYLLFNPPHPVV